MTKAGKFAQGLVAKILLVLSGVSSALLLVYLAAPFLGDLLDQRGADESLGVIEYTVGMGDLFVNYPDQIEPPENPHEVLSRHILEWDSDGFRLPAKPAASYDILAFGDSYTEGASVALPWPDILAQETGLNVRNMGFRGYGPVEEAQVIQEFASDTTADIVILGMFAGNDFSDAEAAKDRPNALLRDLAVDLFSRAVDRAAPWESDHPGPFRYPVQVDLNGELREMAFQDAYTWWLNIEKDDLRRSSNMRIIRESWETIKVALDDDVCFILAYFPGKSQTYLPFVIPEHRERLLVQAEQRLIEAPGEELSDIDVPNLTYERLMSRRDNVREVVAEEARKAGLIFFDLSPIFEQAAANGALLYYTYDTHWSQEGHNQAGQALADFIRQGACEG